MARPCREGFDYFSLDTNFFTDDTRIRALKYRYQADGLMVYIYLLSKIYRDHGYYTVYDDDLEYAIAGDTGVPVGKVRQVMIYLCGRDLLNKVTVGQPPHGVDYLTSAGIQRRFQLMAKSRKREVCVFKELWLLSREETEPFIKVFPSVGLSRNNEGFSGRNPNKSGENPYKEKKSKEYIYTSPAGHPRTDGWFEDPEVDQAFSNYLMMRLKRGDQLVEEQIAAMVEYIDSSEAEKRYQIEMINRATAGGWTNFYPVRRQQPKKPKQTKGSSRGSFYNFEQRDYDFPNLEKQLLMAGMQEGSDGSVRSG